jgi:hypothetical protein
LVGKYNDTLWKFTAQLENKFILRLTRLTDDDIIESSRKAHMIAALRRVAGKAESELF